MKGLDDRGALAAAARILGVASAVDEIPLHAALPITDRLQQIGITSREVQVDDRDLRMLQLPALLALDGGEWLLLLRRTWRKITFVSASGTGTATDGALKSQHAGVAVELALPVSGGRSAWRTILSTLPFVRQAAVQFVVIALIAQLAAVVPPLLSRSLIDNALPSGARSLTLLLTFALLASAAFQAWLGLLRQQALLFIVSRVETLTAPPLLRHILRLPFPFLQEKTVGDLTQSFYGMAAARRVVMERWPSALFDTVTALVFFVLMLSIMPGLAGVVFAVCLVLAFLAFWSGRRQGRVQKEAVEASAVERTFMVEILSGMPTIKTACAEESVVERWFRYFSRTMFLDLRRQRIVVHWEATLEIARGLLMALIAVFGAALVLRDRATVGDLVAFMQFTTGFLAAALTLSNTYLVQVASRPQIDRTDEALALLPVPQGRRFSRAPEVRCSNVSFRYGEELPWIVRNRDLEVEPGQRRRIEGPSGSGKTTFLRLLAGLYAPEEGTIRAGGLDPSRQQLDVLYLPQVVQLFNASILENLRLYSGGAERGRLLEMARQTGLDEWVSRLPMGYDTACTSGGANFSGGQRQLIAITGAAASASPLLLLDEPMANLDSVSQTRVLRCDGFTGKTIIYVAHTEGV
jgi:ABC-type bacteriocin/lantibiotic exporter with double-glycine peptidase domain